MSKQEVITQATRLLSELPEDKAAETLALLTRILREAGEDADLQTHYASLRQQREEAELSRDLTWLAAHGGAFDWLHDEPDLYTDDDLIEKYR